MNKLSQHPNIILLMLDAARQDMFGCYGNNEGLTPNIDKLAQEGVILKNHYAAGCGSAQAHVSIFSGQHSERHKMFHNFCDLSDDILMMPSVLKELGYKTFGHMRVSICPPAGYEDLFGFDEMVYPGSGVAGATTSRNNVSKAIASIRKIATLTARKVLTDKMRLRLNARMYDGSVSLQYLLGKLKKYKNVTPTFAYTTLLHPHLPYFPPKLFLEKVTNGKKINRMAYMLQDTRNIYAYANGDYGDAEEAIDSIRMLYKAELLYGDYLVGRFVDGLKKEGILDNTILIITSDHGEYLGEHRLLTHGNMVWDEQFKTPCIIRYPEKIQQGSVVEFMTSGLDIVPTLFGIISQKKFLEDRTVIDGKDIYEKCDDWMERFLVVDSPPVVLPDRLKKYPNVMYESSIIRRALRTKDMKYVWQSDGLEYLFRVSEKEEEENNIIETEKDVAQQFKKKLVAYYENLNPNFKIDEYPVKLGKKAANKIINPEIRTELKKLGYL